MGEVGAEGGLGREGEREAGTLMGSAPINNGV